MINKHTKRMVPTHARRAAFLTFLPLAATIACENPSGEEKCDATTKIKVAQGEHKTFMTDSVRFKLGGTILNSDAGQPDRLLLVVGNEDEQVMLLKTGDRIKIAQIDPTNSSNIYLDVMAIGNDGSAEIMRTTCTITFANSPKHSITTVEMRR